MMCWKSLPVATLRRYAAVQPKCFQIFAGIVRMQGELEHISHDEMERAIKKWERSICPICNKEYLHSRFYRPTTCLQKTCIYAYRETQESAEQAIEHRNDVCTCLTKKMPLKGF